ncbi:Hypothetical protein ETEE_1861 [Edwardsiella anguillarum ET080813]|uniref:Uncharacterized protein n=1 Tax=Edwardsiella anguillarum ET080813 TaxID=667120 RepID=A0A076LNV5_9GAMM|nr:Hypothetical protein ETEE_1861 [Edwardsiella anguillarum ET080813]
MHMSLTAGVQAMSFYCSGLPGLFRRCVGLVKGISSRNVMAAIRQRAVNREFTHSE